MDILKELSETEDIWSYLERCGKKIVLYGMGDGADKILDVCEKKNINVSDVFASDEFVRGQSFRGYTVKKYADIKNAYGNPVILVSFATRLDTVLKKIYNLNKSDEIYAPDVPVFGDGIFDSKYLQDNFDSFETVFSLLEDDISRKVYTDIIAGKITGKIEYLINCETDVSEAYNNIITPKNFSSYVDIGAYNGDTIREYLTYAKDVKKIFAFEPDTRNYKKLAAYCESISDIEVKLVNKAAWDKCEKLTFYSRSGRNSAGTTVHKGLKATEIDADIADSYIDSTVDFINIDAEGSDLKAIVGLEKTILSYEPTVSCAVYHRNEDMFQIPLHLAQYYRNGFKMYFRHFPYIPSWDTNVYIKSTSR